MSVTGRFLRDAECAAPTTAPFDVAHQRIHEYALHNTVALAAYMKKALREELRRLELMKEDGRRTRRLRAAVLPDAANVSVPTGPAASTPRAVAR
jgi:hypothetical protein